MQDVTAVSTPEAAPDTPAESAPAKLFHYSTWVHVGGGAEDCTEVNEETGENRCSDSGHFHAFCRLPNQFQEREIRVRAQAAKARKLRQLRSEETDAHEILEQELEDLRTGDVKPMVDELLGYDWTNDYLTAVRQVRDLDDESEGADEDEKLYGGIDDDRRRFAHIQAQPEEERDQDELNELKVHLAAYEQAVKDGYEALVAPKRESYETMAEDDLIELLRRKRMQGMAQQEFMESYSVQEWLSCSNRQPGGEPSFADLGVLERADRLVIDRLSETFADLERTAQGASGN